MLREVLRGKGSLCLLPGSEAALTLTAIGAPCSVPDNYFRTHQQYFGLSKLLESVSNTTCY